MQNCKNLIKNKAETEVGKITSKAKVGKKIRKFIFFSIMDEDILDNNDNTETEGLLNPMNAGEDDGEDEEPGSSSGEDEEESPDLDLNDLGMEDKEVE